MKIERHVNSLKHANDNPKFSASREYSASEIDSSENQGLDDGKLVSTKNREVVYIKRKANQLIAAFSSSDLPAPNANKTEALSSGGSFKWRKNQLVRKSMEIGLKVGLPNESLIYRSISASQIIASSYQRRAGKGLGKMCRPSTSKKKKKKMCKPSRSLVWTLHDAQSVNSRASSYATAQPLFVSSGVIEIKAIESRDPKNVSEQSNIVENSAKYGAFELHTTGFGSKVMAEMGFMEGGGLGKDGQGMTHPIELTQRPKALGLGAECSGTSSAIPKREKKKKKKPVKNQTQSFVSFLSSGVIQSDTKEIKHIEPIDSKNVYEQTNIVENPAKYGAFEV